MASFLQSLGLVSKPDPVDQAKEWQRKVKKEHRAAEREIRELERTEQAMIREVKKVAKLGTRGGTAVKTLARNVVQARKAKEKAYMAAAQLNSVSMTLGHQVAMIKVSRCMEKSADVMRAMNDAIKLPQLSADMLAMAREMERAGLIEELVGDALALCEPTELEGEADQEVERVLAELTVGLFGEGTDVATAKKLPPKKVEEVVEVPKEEIADESVQEMMARMQAL